MYTGVLLVSWGILASSLAFPADGSSISATGDIAAKLKGKGFATIQDFEKPSEEEWVEIIKATLHGGSLPNYLAERNYTYHAMQTGESHDTDGNSAFWNATSYIHYRVTEDDSERSLIRVESMRLGDLHLVLSSKMSSLSTAFSKNAYVSTNAFVGSTFEVRDETYQMTGGVLGFGQGEGIAVDGDRLQFIDNNMELVNSSHVYSISAEQSMGTIFFNSSKVEGASYGNSFPLRNLPVGALPKDFKTLAQMSTAGKESSSPISIAYGTFNRGFTLEGEGEYHSDSEDYTLFQDGHIVNTTTTLKGTYKEIQSIETDLRIQSRFGTTMLHFR